MHFYVRNVIYKMKSYFPQPAQGASHTTAVLLRKLDCVLHRLERESGFPFNKNYLIFLK